MICPKCLTRGMIRFGLYGNQQKWRCLKCGYTTVHPRQRMPKKKEE